MRGSAQTGASSATARYVLALAKHAGLRTLNVVRRAESVTSLLDAGADVVLVEGDDLAEQAADAIGDAPLELIIDGVAGEPVAQLAPLLKTGGQIVSYTARGRQPLSISILDLIFRGLSVHGYWLNLWLQSTPRETVAQTYRELAALVADGTLAAPVEATYALADYREAIAHAARQRPQRQGALRSRISAQQLRNLRPSTPATSCMSTDDQYAMRSAPDNRRQVEHRSCSRCLGGRFQLELGHRAPAGRRLPRHGTPVSPHVAGR